MAHTHHNITLDYVYDRYLSGNVSQGDHDLVYTFVGSNSGNGTHVKTVQYTAVGMYDQNGDYVGNGNGAYDATGALLGGQGDYDMKVSYVGTGLGDYDVSGNYVGAGLGDYTMRLTFMGAGQGAYDATGKRVGGLGEYDCYGNYVGTNAGNDDYMGTNQGEYLADGTYVGSGNGDYDANHNYVGAGLGEYRKDIVYVGANNGDYDSLGNYITPVYVDVPYTGDPYIMVYIFAPTGEFENGVEITKPVAYKVFLNVLEADTGITKVTIEPGTVNENSTTDMITDPDLNENYYQVYIPYTDELIPTPELSIQLVDKGGRLKVLDGNFQTGMTTDAGSYIVSENGVVTFTKPLTDSVSDASGNLSYYRFEVSVLSSLGVSQVEQLRDRRATVGTAEYSMSTAEFQQMLDEMYAAYTAHYTIRVIQANMDLSLELYYVYKDDSTENGFNPEFDTELNAYLVYEKEDRDVAGLFRATAGSEGNRNLKILVFHTMKDSQDKWVIDSSRPEYFVENGRVMEKIRQLRTGMPDETAYVIRVQSTEINGGGPYKDYLMIIRKMSDEKAVRVVVTYRDSDNQQVRQAQTPWMCPLMRIPRSSRALRCSR